ncbi:UNVERIFIED_CONTAM: hypothetical protein O8I53_05720 [Campylobacter lari]
MFKGGLTTNYESLAIVFIAYGIASIGVGISFKSGLFNIGVPGQMMLGGTMSFVMIGILSNLKTKNTAVLSND